MAEQSQPDTLEPPAEETPDEVVAHSEVHAEALRLQWLQTQGKSKPLSAKWLTGDGRISIL